MARGIRRRPASRRHRPPRLHHAHRNRRTFFRQHLQRPNASPQSPRRNQVPAQATRTVARRTCRGTSSQHCSQKLPNNNGRKLIVRTFADRELKFVKLLAQKLTRQSPNAIALLATASPQPSLIFAQSTGQPHDMGALLKETMAKLGGRGGGSKDMAQGGVPTADGLEDALAQVSAKLSEAPAAP